MSCDQANWTAAGEAYAADMAALETACLQQEADTQALADAEAAVEAARIKLEQSTAAHDAAKIKAANSQLILVAEAEKLGVECHCPEGGIVEPVSGPFGGK